MKPLFLCLLLHITVESFAAIFTVTTVNDAGTNSLRQAILDANANPDMDEIHFNILGIAPHIIALNSPLPIITSPILFNGTSQPNWILGAIVLDGQDVIATAIRIENDDCRFNGLQFSNFTFHCFEIINSHHIQIDQCLFNNFSSIDAIAIFCQISNNALIQNCKFGTDATGNVNQNGNGLAGILFIGVTDSIISNNQIIGFHQAGMNRGWGIYFDGTGNNNNQISSNLIGLNTTLTTIFPNHVGIQLAQNSMNNLIDGNVIGGSILSGIVLQTMGGL